MNRENIVFTPTDHKILESYIKTIEGLADYLGNIYELVLHSLEDLDHSVIFIINGRYTGRKIGSPITDLALSMLAKIERNESQDYISYYSKNKNGEPLKSTTIAIRGENSRIIGLLCINLHLNTPLYSFMSHLFPDKEANSMTTKENFGENVDDLIINVLNEVKESVYNDTTISSNNKNKEIVTLLYNKGIFNLKDSVITVSKMLGISKNTVYMHLRNLNKVSK